MQQQIKLHDKTFEMYISEDQIRERLQSLAQQINADYKNAEPLILSILNGSFVFAADLVRLFDFPMKVEFVRYSSYEGMESSGSVKQLIGLKSSLENEDVLIIEDIVDTGQTLSNALEEMKTHNPRSLKVVSLLLKPEAVVHPVPVDYVGFEIPNKFVVGYGLDYDELGRDLPAIYQLVENSDINS